MYQFSETARYKITIQKSIVMTILNLTLKKNPICKKETKVLRDKFN